MIIECTRSEKDHIISILEKYNDLLSSKQEEIFRAKKSNKNIANLIEERDNLETQKISEIQSVYEKAEKDRIDALGSDTAVILKEAKLQIDLIIEQRIASDIVSDDVKELAKQIESGEITAAQAIEKINNGSFMLRRDSENKPFLSSREARELIKSGLSAFFTRLENHEKEKTELNDYINDYIIKSNYIYISDGNTPIKELEKARKPIPTIETYGILNDKLVNGLPYGGYYGENNGHMIQSARVHQEKRGSAPVTVSVALTFEGDKPALSKRMTEYDSAVYNAISTAFYYHKLDNTSGKFNITPQEIWRIMNGTQDTKKNPSAAQIEKVCESVDKMRFTRVDIDLRNEIEKYDLKINNQKIKSGRIETYLLKSEKVDFITEKGQEISGYQIDSEPVLYSYCQAKKHILFVPFGLLDTSKTTGNEGYTVEFRSYLLQQIQLMKSGHRNSCRILYDTIYNKTGIKSPNDRCKKEDYKNDNTFRATVKRESKNDREKIYSILEAWKEKGYIKDFEPVIENRSYTGIDVTI